MTEKNLQEVSRLHGAELDYWVARALGWVEKHRIVSEEVAYHDSRGGTTRAVEKSDYGMQWWTGKEWKQRYGFNPSKMWSDAGPLIEKNQIAIDPVSRSREPNYWQAQVWMPYACQTGETPLIAAMRALVASVYGEELPTEVQP